MRGKLTLLHEGHGGSAVVCALAAELHQTVIAAELHACKVDHQLLTELIGLIKFCGVDGQSQRRGAVGYDHRLVDIAGFVRRYHASLDVDVTAVLGDVDSVDIVALCRPICGLEIEYGSVHVLEVRSLGHDHGGEFGILCTAHHGSG